MLGMHSKESCRYTYSFSWLNAMHIHFLWRILQMQTLLINPAFYFALVHFSCVWVICKTWVIEKLHSLLLQNIIQYILHNSRMVNTCLTIVFLLYFPGFLLWFDPKLRVTSGTANDLCDLLIQHYYRCLKWCVGEGLGRKPP